MKIYEGYKTQKRDFLFAELSREVAKFKSENKSAKVIDLGVGDVKLPPVKPVARALVKAAKKMSNEKSFTGYPPACGCEFLREKIADDYVKNGVCVQPDEVFITDGAKRAICDIVEIIRPESSLILSPAYPLYKDICEALGVKTYFASGSPQNDFFAMPNADRDSAVCPDVIFICSPSNPTGAVINEKTLEKYIDYALEKQSLIVFDGAYASFLTKNFSPFSLNGAGAAVAEVRSYSKSLSFTGIRCGYVIIKKENPLYAAYKKHAVLHCNGVSVISQYGAAAAYSLASKKLLSARVQYYRDNAKIIARELQRTGAYFTGGVNSPYLFLKTPCSGFEFSRRLLYSYAVVVTPGEGFGAQNFVRISCFCTKKQALAAARAISDLIAKIALND